MNADGSGLPHVVVVGGGISGLAAAHRVLADADGRVRVTVLEASDRFGGKIRTVRRDGLVLDGGPDAFVITKPHALKLAREVGLGDRLIETTAANRRVYFCMNGKTFNLPEGLVLAVPTRFWPLMKSPLFSFGGLARMGLDFVLPRRASDEDESIGAFLRRRLGRQAAERLGDPLLGGIYAGDPERLSIHATFPQLVDLEKSHGSLVRGALAGRRAAARRRAESGALAPRHPPSPFMSFKGGMAELWEGVLAAIEQRGGGVRTGAEVSRIVEQGAGFEVFVTSASGEERMFADHVVLATPTLATASLLDALEPEAARELRGIPLVTSATCLLAYPAGAIAHALDGVGMLIPKSEGRQAVALTFVTSKWAGRAPEGTVVLRVFLGGYARPEIRNLTDDDVAALAERELDLLLGVTGRPLSREVFRWTDSNPQPILGHAERIERVLDRCRRFEALSLAGAAFDGVGVPDCIKRGEEVAKVALTRLLREGAGEPASAGVAHA